MKKCDGYYPTLCNLVILINWENLEYQVLNAKLMYEIKYKVQDIYISVSIMLANNYLLNKIK